MVRGCVLCFQQEGYLDVKAYFQIFVNDLHNVIIQNGFIRCLTEDGCHMTEFGNEVLSDAVVEAIGRQV